MTVGGNGQWARARNEAGARSLVEEMQMDSDRRFAQKARTRAFWRRMRGSIARFRQSRRERTTRRKDV